MSISVTELNTNEIINSFISESSGHEYLDYLNLVLVKPCFCVYTFTVDQVCCLLTVSDIFDIIKRLRTLDYWR